MGTHYSMLGGFNDTGGGYATPPSIDANTKMLLHCDGADASTTITDAVGTHTPACYQDAKLATAQKRFGTASLWLPDTPNSRIEIAAHNDLDIAGDAFTFDFWARHDDTSAGQGYFEIQAGAGLVDFCFYGGNTFLFKVTGAASIDIYGTATMENDIWYHIAVIRGWNNIANLFAICLNGQCIGTKTEAGAVTARTHMNVGVSYLYNFEGYIDEFRFSNVARWTEPFIPYYNPYND